jgi:hypothetical protein
LRASDEHTVSGRSDEPRPGAALFNELLIENPAATFAVRIAGKGARTWLQAENPASPRTTIQSDR